MAAHRTLESMVRSILRNRPLVMTVLGMIIMAQSILWEYVRVEPTYRFIVDPWSLRGYELPHGLVIATASIGIALMAVLIARNVIKETILSSSIAVGVMVVAAVVLAMAVDAKEVKMPFPVHVVLSLIGAVVVVAVLERFIPANWKQRRRLARGSMGVAGFVVVLFAVVGPILQNKQPFWVFIALTGIILAGLVLFRPPAQLAARRMLINAITGLWVMSMSMSASLRQALLEAQSENGINATILDLQITSGVILAWLGGLVAFAGAVGMWARRRDQIIAHERAAKQEAAARESEQQLAIT